jgi:hypothetical protein
MANAQVEKLKDLGLRHGEKIVVGLAATVCVVLVVLALKKPSIALTADEIKQAANAARQNIDRQVDNKALLEQIEADGLKDPGFVKVVQERATRLANVETVALSHPFTYPDPGAGLIREAIELLAPTDLIAHAGRGGIHVFALDDSGNRIPEDPTKADTKKAAAGRPGMSSAMGSGGYYAGASGAMPRGLAQREAEAKKAADRAEQLKRRAVAGNLNAPRANASATEDATTPAVEVPWQEVTKGSRWVALTGLLDNKRLRENYARALKIDYSSAYPNFVRLDVQRQQRTREEDWSEWASIDRAANQRVFDNLTEQDDDEWTPPEVRLSTLVDILPFLRAGYWAGVHHVALVPKERLEAPKPVATGAMPGYMASSGMMSSSSSSSSGMMSSGMMPGATSEMSSSSASSSMMSMSSSGGGGMMSGMPGGLGGGPEDTNFPKSESETIMARSLDFTVAPDTFYRYRLRIVVHNPNLDRGDVSPGVDNTSEELTGPWSEETEEILVPPDVTTYAVHKAPALGQTPRDDVVDFQVARWNPDDGMTVVHAFSAAPGQVIGEPYNIRVPLEGEPPKPKLIDFNSRQLVLDSMGGSRPMPVPGVGGAAFDVPAVAAVLRSDGTVVVRNQASDAHNPELDEVKRSYDEAIKAAGQRRQPAMSGYGSGSSGSSMMMPGATGP